MSQRPITIYEYYRPSPGTDFFLNPIWRGPTKCVTTRIEGLKLQVA